MCVVFTYFIKRKDTSKSRLAQQIGKQLKYKSKRFFLTTFVANIEPRKISLQLVEI